MSYFNIYLEDGKLPGWRHVIVIERGRKWTTLYYPPTGERVKLLNVIFDKARKEPAKLRKGALLKRIREGAVICGENTDVFKEAFREAVRLVKAA